MYFRTGEVRDGGESSRSSVVVDEKISLRLAGIVVVFSSNDRAEESYEIDME